VLPISDPQEFLVWQNTPIQISEKETHAAHKLQKLCWTSKSKVEGEQGSAHSKTRKIEKNSLQAAIYCRRGSPEKTVAILTLHKPWRCEIGAGNVRIECLSPHGALSRHDRRNILKDTERRETSEQQAR
jgi:RNase P/RNase MRP subunit POP5